MDLFKVKTQNKVNICNLTMQTIASYSLVTNLLTQLIYDQVIQLKFNCKNVKFNDSLVNLNTSRIIITASSITNESIQDVPILVTLLDESDYKFRHQSSTGLPIDHDFAVFSGRSMNFYQVVSFDFFSLFLISIFIFLLLFLLVH